MRAQWTLTPDPGRNVTFTAPPVFLSAREARGDDGSARGRDALRELVQVDWVRSVLVRVATAPEWVTHLDECTITFEAREERTGKPGVKLERAGAFIIMSPDGVSAESAGQPEGLEMTAG